jgi:hypothetical protein
MLNDYDVAQGAKASNFFQTLVTLFTNINTLRAFNMRVSNFEQNRQF